jgi:hypothetical protein
MPAVVPSYLEKISRAEKHLVELHEAIDQYAAAKPYTVRKGIEGKKEKVVHRLVFTADPANTDIPVIAADVIYNLRSALDHLMSALVANKDRGSAMFPIFFQGVWEAIVPGENQQRVKERMRWASDIKTLRDEPVAILKRLQPREDTGDGTQAIPIAVINSLSNRDRHEKLPIFVSGLLEVYFRWTLPDGTVQRGKGISEGSDLFFENKARLQIPEDAMDVEIEGTPLVAVRVGQDKAGRDRHLMIPTFLDELMPSIRADVIDKLVPYVVR